MDKEKIIDILSDKLRLVRTEYDFSQEKMALVLGLSKKTLIQIEKGRNKLGWAYAVALCAIFRESEILQMTLGGNPVETMASLGCIRMYNRDVEEIFPEVPIGTSVEIISGGGSYNPKPQTPSQGTSGQRYIVQRGDTLWRLSQRFGVSLDALIKANNLSKPNMIYPGQKLIIPG